MHQTAIRRITATPLNIPVRFDLPGFTKETALSLTLVEVETADGTIGHGFTAITEEEAIAAIVNEVAGPALISQDALAREALWDRLYWLLVPRGQTGYACHAIAAIDLALWDIAGKRAGQPVWRMLGAARPTAPAYVTFGFASMERDVLAAAAAHWVSKGATRLKMTVGHHALARRDEPRPVMEVLREDVERVRAVRQAIGPDPVIFLDGNCSLDAFQARWIAERVTEFGIGFFEEPLAENDPRLLAEFRRITGLPVAAGQNEGLLHRFRALLEADAVDVLQPNVVIGGGITQCMRAAALAQAFGRQIANGGAFAHANIHLHCGLAHGGMVEYHHAAVLVMERLFGPLSRPEAGLLAAPDAPGLGLVPDPAALRELARLPTSRGKGKA